MTATTPLAPTATPVTRKPSIPARLPGMTARAGWRYRDHLVLPLAGVAVWAANDDATLTGTACLAGALAAGGGVAWWSRRFPRPIARMSEKERPYIAGWCGAAALWTAIAGIAPATPGQEGIALAAAIAYPTGRWSWNRWVRRERINKAARAYAARWDRDVAKYDHGAHGGPHILAGSQVIAGTVSCHGDGAVTFKVKLRHGVHNDEASTTSARQSAEVRLNLPRNTLAITPNDDASWVILVAISPRRHMETKDGIDWPEPVIHDDGSIPIAEGKAGNTAALRLHDKDGVKHWWIVGASGGGKSTLLNVILTAAALGRDVVILYCDGGGSEEGSTSIGPELEPLLTRIANTREEWIALIDIAWRVMIERKPRRTGLYRNKWRVGKESDPIVLLVIDEASTVAAEVPAETHRQVVQIGQMGRKFGTGLIQITQGTRGDLLVGGVDAKTNLTQIAALRPNTSNSAGASVDSSAGEVKLLTLPPQPGWCALIDTGQAAFPVRIRHAREEHVAEFTEGYVAREFVGADLDAAGERYSRWGEPFEIETAPGPSVVDRNEEARAQILAVLRDVAPKGLLLSEIQDDQRVTRARRTISGHLIALHGRGEVTQDKDASRWFAARQEEAR